MLGVLRAIRDFIGDLFQVLSRCRYSALIVAIGVGAFLVVPQGQDVLRRVAEWGPGSLGSLPPDEEFWAIFRVTVFVVAVTLWAASTWYWARVILHLRLPGEPVPSPRQAWLRTWVPRILGSLALAGIAGALWRAAGSYYTAIVENRGPILRLEVLSFTCLGLAAVFFAATIERRRWMVARATRKGLDLPAATNQFDGVADLPPDTQRAGVVSLVVALAQGLVFTFWPIAAGRAGAAAILLLTAATWVLYGTGILHLGRLLRVPLVVVLLLAAVIFSFWNDNHAIRLAATADTRSKDSPEASIADRFATWYREIEGDNFFLVAAEGGGIRAAYWTATVLSELEDRKPGFARHVFAISGISGGSLGAAVFDALLVERQAGHGVLRCVPQPPPGHTLRGCADAVLRPDFLSPTLAKMIVPDLVQRFLPFRVPLFDRGRTLEDAWASAWHGAVGSDRFDRSILELSREGGLGLPSLVLNITHVESGRRMIASNLRWAPGELIDAYDLLKTLDSDVPLKSAVHAGARFTYISPAGTLRKRQPKEGELRVRGHVVDGGYFESSGAETVIQLLSTILGRRPDLGPRLHVLYLRNTPASLPDKKATPRPDDEPQARAYPSLNELLSPPRALLNARDARASLATAGLRVGLGKQRLIEIGLCDKLNPEGQMEAPLPLPLGWEVSESARAAMSAQLDRVSPCGDNPGIVRSVIALLPGAGGAGPAGGSADGDRGGAATHPAQR